VASLARLASLTLGAALLVASCGEKPKSDTPPPTADNPATAAVAPQDPATATYAASLNIDLAHMSHTPNGLYYTDLKLGKGARADSGKMVSVHYTGYFTDGREFETSTTSSPFAFTLGREEVIQGWDEGLPGMRVGGKRQLVIPSSLAYGDQGNPPTIPGGAILVFTVELMAVN
jgi:FKBP-type peptidyl-prolyl cis-trans isomerase FkpA